MATSLAGETTGRQTLLSFNAMKYDKLLDRNILPAKVKTNGYKRYVR